MKNAPTVVKPNLLQKIAERYAVDAEKLLVTLKATAFRQRQGKEISDAQMTALMIVADQYGLNPFTKELYAYPDKDGIVPVVSVDGWTRIINGNPALDGIVFTYAEDTATPPHGKECPVWIECSITRKDRNGPIKAREYLDECYRQPFKRDDGSVVNGPWQTHTKRFLRHKALIQCSRIAFGFAGIYDDDEAQRIVERDITSEVQVIEGPKAKSVKPETIVEKTSEQAPAPKDPNPSPQKPDTDPGKTRTQMLTDLCEQAAYNFIDLLAKAEVNHADELSDEDYESAKTMLRKRITKRMVAEAGEQQP